MFFANSNVKWMSVEGAVAVLQPWASRLTIEDNAFHD